MATLPWTVARPERGRPDDPSGPGPVLVLASRLELRRFRTAPAFLAAAMRVRAQVRRSPGALGVSLVAERNTPIRLSELARLYGVDGLVLQAEASA